MPTHDLTIEQFTKVMPGRVKSGITIEVIDKINLMVKEPEMREIYRDNLLGYASIMADGRFKLSSYLDAIRYTSFKLLGGSNIDSYIKAFPDRYAAHIANGTTSKDIASYVTAYSKNKLVIAIMEQAAIPTHLLNQDVFQEAINTQADIMRDEEASFKVRSDAANSLLTHLKAPETKKIELEIGQTQSKSIDELRGAVSKLVEVQLSQIEDGTSNAKLVAHSKIIEGVCEEV